MKVNKLEWDSHFFKKKIGEILVHKLNQSISGGDFDLIYVKSEHNDAIEIQNFKQTFFEVKVIFSKKIAKIEQLIHSNIISFSDADLNKEMLYNLAFESGKYSRFNLDKNFKLKEFHNLYKKWIDNSIAKIFSDGILIYKEDATIMGFVTYKVYEQYATIGLIAVNPSEQGKGIGSALIIAVENELKSLKIYELRIPTQLANEAACGFYTKLGYKIIEKLNIKHYWKI